MKFGQWLQDSKLLGTENEEALRQYREGEELFEKYGELEEKDVDKLLEDAGARLMDYLGAGEPQEPVSEFAAPRAIIERSEQYCLSRQAVRAMISALQRHFDPKRFDHTHVSNHRPWEKELRMLGYSCVEHLMVVLRCKWVFGCSWENFGTDWTVRPAFDHGKFTEYGDEEMRAAWGPDGVRIAHTTTGYHGKLKPFIKMVDWVQHHVPRSKTYTDVEMPKGWEEPRCIYLATVKKLKKRALKEQKKALQRNVG